MQEAGFPISDHYSGFRSYETQNKLYQDYVNQDGKEAADRYSARPGYSEHQTGLAFDVIGTDGDLVTEEKAAQWLLDHAADYGFVVRYLKVKKKKRDIWLKNGTFVMSEKKQKKLLRVVSVWKSTTDLKVEIMSINTLRKSNSTTSASPYRTQVQPAASFLVCSLIFSEYKKGQVSIIY